MIIKLLLGALLGGAAGLLIGHCKKCTSGGSSLTANPLRSVLYGAVLGAFLAVSFGPTPHTAFAFEEEQPAPTQGVIYIGTPEVFEETILQSSRPCLVDFYSDSCPPCRRLSPVIDALAEKYAGRAVICKVNVATARELSAAYQIYGIPDVLFFQNGKMVERLGGLRSQSTYEDVLDHLLQNEEKGE